jgi:hypothetical protein
VAAAQVAWLKELKDESLLKITFKVNFNKVPNTETVLTFPLRDYNIKNIRTIAGHESWETANIQRFKIDTPIKFESGIIFTLLAAPVPTWASQTLTTPEALKNIIGQRTLFCINRNSSKFSWDGVVTNISFLVVHAHAQDMHQVIYYRNQEQIHSEFIPFTGNQSATIKYEAPAGKYVTHFVIKCENEPNDDGFYLDEINWS